MRGIDYNGYRVKIAVSNYWGAVKVHQEWETDGDFDALIKEKLPGMVKNLIDKNGINHDRLYGIGIGIGIPTSVDTKNVIMELGPLSGISIKKRLSETLHIFARKMGLPVYIFNDINAAAIGEYVSRRLEADDLIYISSGMGFGAGIILDGNLRVGRHFYTGEIAHMIFDQNHTTDINQPGWFEIQLSSETLCEKFPGYKNGERSEEMIEYIAQHIALVIANICNVLDMQMVILGGELVEEMGNLLNIRVKHYAERLCLFDVEIHNPSNNDCVPIGAASMAISQEIDNALEDVTDKRK